MPRPLSADAREDWELLAAQGEWLREAAARRFAPWPTTGGERLWLRRAQQAHFEAVAAWRDQLIPRRGV